MSAAPVLTWLRVLPSLPSGDPGRTMSSVRAEDPVSFRESSGSFPAQARAHQFQFHDAKNKRGAAHHFGLAGRTAAEAERALGETRRGCAAAGRAGPFSRAGRACRGANRASPFPIQALGNRAGAGVAADCDFCQEAGPAFLPFGKASHPKAGYVPTSAAGPRSGTTGTAVGSAGL